MNSFYFLNKQQTQDVVHNHLHPEKNDSKKLDILKKIGLQCEMSGFSILLGGHYGVNDDKAYGIWWLQGKSYYGGQEIINEYGSLSDAAHFIRYVGARPAILADMVLKNGINCGINEQGILEYKYVDYPEVIESTFSSWQLEQAYKSGKVKVTGKKYTTDSADFHKGYEKYSNFQDDVYFSYDELADDTSAFIPREHIEYEYKGNKYIRFIADANCAGKFLPDGRICALNRIYWVRVKPITWLIDKEANVALAKKIVFAGVPYYKYPKYKHFDNIEQEEFSIYSFMENNLGCFLDLSNEDRKAKIVESLPLSDDTKALLDKIDGLIKVLSPEDMEIMLEKRNALIEKYQADLAKRERVNFESFSNPVKLTLEENQNPEVSLHISLYDLAFMLNKPEELVKRIKQMDSYLELFQTEIKELPGEIITKEDMIKAIVFYANKYDDKYLGKQLKDKLEATLTSYKEQCKLELENFSLAEAIKPTLDNNYFDKDLKLMGQIMGALDRAVSYNENLGHMLNLLIS